MAIQIRTDFQKRDFVYDTLLEAYFAKKPPYDANFVPQIPENLPNSFQSENVNGLGRAGKFIYFERSCLWMRGGVKSDTAMKKVSKMFDDSPHLFDPFKVEEIDLLELEALIKETRLGLVNQALHAWKPNLILIRDKWNGNPENIFKDVVNSGLSDEKKYQELCRRIAHRKKDGLIGFQEKMVSMLTYFYMDAKLIPSFKFPVPVDFHVLRLHFANQIIEDASDSETNDRKIVDYWRGEILDAIRDLTFEYAVRHQVSPIDLANALWIYSRSRCSAYPGTRTKRGDIQGRSTQLEMDSLIWDRKQVKAWQKSCESCQLRDRIINGKSIKGTCAFAIPSSFHYYHGKTLLIKREEPPFQQTSLGEEFARIATMAAKIPPPKTQERKMDKPNDEKPKYTQIDLAFDDPF